MNMYVVWGGLELISCGVALLLIVALPFPWFLISFIFVFLTMYFYVRAKTAT